MNVERPLPVEGQPPRITELFAWTVIDPMTDVEGILAAKFPGGGGLPLVASMREVAEKMRPIAEATVRAAEEPRPILKLRRFVPAD